MLHKRKLLKVLRSGVHARANSLLILALELLPAICFASVESSLMGIQNRLTRVILPICSMIGIGWAGFSFLTGNERAKTHIWYALIGSALGFGAQAIVNFISETVH